MLRRKSQHVPLIGTSSKLVELRAEMERVALSDAKVLITGETGTGKELFARAVHQNSNRSKRNSMIYDCLIFNGEKDLLEIRLNETCLCNDWVTTVIVEADVNHVGEPKEPYFEQYQDEFKKFNIFYYVVEDMPVGSTPKEMEAFQRNQIKKCLVFLEPKLEDKIINIFNYNF
jgi:Cdc6-like AAA superfamily ATPase